MKHLKPRDILETILFLLCFIAIFGLAGHLETAPMAVVMWMGGGMGIVLWVAYFIIVAQQRKAEVNRQTLWMAVNGYWVAQDGSGRKFPMQKTTQPLFDQDQKEAS